MHPHLPDRTAPTPRPRGTARLHRPARPLRLRTRSAALSRAAAGSIGPAGACGGGTGASGTTATPSMTGMTMPATQSHTPAGTGAPATGNAATGNAAVLTVAGGEVFSHVVHDGDGSAAAGPAADPHALRFVQVSDSHIGFDGPANTDVTGSFTQAVDRINFLGFRPDFVMHTGDLHHRVSAAQAGPGPRADAAGAARGPAQGRARHPQRELPRGHAGAGLEGGEAGVKHPWENRRVRA